MGVPEGVGPIWCYSVSYLYLLCISCPKDLQCPIKPATIYPSIRVRNMMFVTKGGAGCECP